MYYNRAVNTFVVLTKNKILDTYFHLEFELFFFSLARFLLKNIILKTDSMKNLSIFH